jgi:uncharacterized protein (DUF3820 family)
MKCVHEKTIDKEVIFSNGTVHVERRCSVCGNFIKYVPQNKVIDECYTMPFGKHKGKTLIDIAREDCDYLEWFAGTDSKLAGKIRQYLEEKIFSNKT